MRLPGGKPVIALAFAMWRNDPLSTNVGSSNSLMEFSVLYDTINTVFPVGWERSSGEREGILLECPWES